MATQIEKISCSATGASKVIAVQAPEAGLPHSRAGQLIPKSLPAHWALMLGVVLELGACGLGLPLLTGCTRKTAAAGPPGGMVVQVVAVEARRQAVTESL